jgi:hypothetical protein
MPKKEHARLARAARKKGLTGERRDAYVYGTLNKIATRRAKRRAKSSRKKRS